MLCPKCGKEIADGSPFCQHCGGSLSAAAGKIQCPTLTTGLTVEDFAAFVGRNSEKYLPKFAKFNVGGIDSFKATWHWPAFFIPFWWMLYRKLYGWAILAFFLGVIPYVGLLTHFVWAIAANRLYYNHAKKKLLEIKHERPSSETQKAAIAVNGGVNNAAVIIGVVLGGIIVVGILAAIAIPRYINMREMVRKGAMTRTMASALPELQAWLNASSKGKDKGLGEQRDIDTNGDGNINYNDLTNSELLSKGVCNQYVIMKTSKGNEKSPWDTSVNLWTLSGGKGQISCVQYDGKGITITVFDKNGGAIETKIMSAE